MPFAVLHTIILLNPLLQSITLGFALYVGKSKNIENMTETHPTCALMMAISETAIHANENAPKKTAGRVPTRHCI